MHNAALAELGLAGEWEYEAIDIEADGFEDLVRSLPGRGYAGVNVTVPHKLAALAVADRASGAAREIGAANTLTFAEGLIAADNTDSTGVIRAIRTPVDGMNALVLGAGGSARAAIWALHNVGAVVAVWNRTTAKAASVADEMGVGHLAVGGDRVDAGAYDVVINATTVGLEQAGARAPEPADLKAYPVDADSIGENQTVVDLVYGTYDTALAAHSRERGAHVIDGLEVLVHQGAASLLIWTGIEPPLETMRNAARSSKTNGTRKSRRTSPGGDRRG